MFLTDQRRTVVVSLTEVSASRGGAGSAKCDGSCTRSFYGCCPTFHPLPGGKHNGRETFPPIGSRTDKRKPSGMFFLRRCSSEQTSMSRGLPERVTQVCEPCFSDQLFRLMVFPKGKYSLMQIRGAPSKVEKTRKMNKNPVQEEKPKGATDLYERQRLQQIPDSHSGKKP